MYLLVKAAGKYWRQDYTYADKRKTLALGVYPAVSLAKRYVQQGQVQWQRRSNQSMPAPR